MDITKMQFGDLEVSRHKLATIVLPEGMSYEEAIEWCTRMAEQDQREVEVHERIDAYPLDGGLAFMRALKEMFGWTDLRATPGFFGSKPPKMVAVEIDASGRTVQVPWGRVQIPGVDGFVSTGFEFFEGRLVFKLTGTTRQKHLPVIAKIAARTRELVRTDSIYRGKAIRVRFEEINPEDETFNPFNGVPKFLDLNGVDDGDLIFPRKTMDLVRMTLFTPIEHREACLRIKTRQKRGIVLEGPYGTGKTLCARVTALKAVRHGFTFIYLEEVEHLDQALEFAQQYAPAVIFAEDIDRVDPNQERNAAMNDILNKLDGVELKNAEIITVLTTNHIEKVHDALLRPGRLDAVIPVRPCDPEAAMKLVRKYAGLLLPATESLDQVGMLLNGQIPAVVNEVVERAKLAAVMHRGDANTLRAEDIVVAAEGMLEQLSLMPQTEATNGLEDALHLIGLTPRVTSRG